AGRAHPVQRLIATAVGVHQKTAVALMHEQTRSEGEVGVEPPGVIHGAAGNDETHPKSLTAVRLLLHRNGSARVIHGRSDPVAAHRALSWLTSRWCRRSSP